MRRTARPGLERLEGKAMLSVASPTPGLVASLTAVASRTATGAQVVATLTETNVSNHDITVDEGPSIDGFAVTQGRKAIWSTGDGVNADYIAVHVLKPHQSLSVGATWDGRATQSTPAVGTSEGPPASGSFTVSSTLDRAATAVVTIPRAWVATAKATHVGMPRPSGHRA